MAWHVKHANHCGPIVSWIISSFNQDSNRQILDDYISTSSQCRGRSFAREMFFAALHALDKGKVEEAKVRTKSKVATLCFKQV